MPYPEHRNQKKQHPRAKHGRQCLLPSIFVSQHDRESEESIDAHAWRERDRIVGVECHNKSADRSGDTRRYEHRAGIHPRLSKDDWIDEHDVDHRQKCSHTRNKFGSNISALLSKPEIAIQCDCDLWLDFPRRRHAFCSLDHSKPPTVDLTRNPNAAPYPPSDITVDDVDTSDPAYCRFVLSQCGNTNLLP